jgi:dipeptidyl aminopeptidase/acylaminoacyl peptidase
MLTSMKLMVFSKCRDTDPVVRSCMTAYCRLSRVRRLLPVVLAATVAVAVGAQGGARRITVDDLMGLRTIVDVKISPDGSRVAYVVSRPSVERNAHEPELFVVPAAGGTPTRLAADARIFTPTLPAPRLRWTPDGKRVSFLALVEGRPQVFATPASGETGQAMTTAPQGVSAYEWSPYGSALAYATREPTVSAPAIRVHEPPPSGKLMVKRGNDTVTELASAAQIDGFSWTPDGESVIYAAAPVTGFTAAYYTRIYRVPASGGAATLLVDRAGMNTMPQVSPDGKRLAFVTSNERVGLLAPRVLAVLDLANGGGPRSYSMNGAWIGEMTWAPDSQSLYVLMNEGTFATGAHMFEMPIVRVSIESGSADRVVAGEIVNYSVSISRDGRTLAYREVEPRSMGEVVVRDVVSGQTRRLTSVNPELAQFALGELKAITWRSFDGMAIWGLLITPPLDEGKGKLPLIVYCHGGPIGGVTYGIFPQFMHAPGQIDPYPVEALVAAGYAVLLPMPRGGSGYGEAGHRAIINAWGEADYRDIMAGIDFLVADGTADGDRLGVMGASYGGFMTNWIVTQTARFKAASSSASISDLTDLYYLADAGAVMDEYFKKPWENRESYIAHSPLTFVERVHTPLLLQHGENDPRVPIASARKFYEALKALGRTVEFDIFPRGSHVQYQPIAERESMQRNYDWFLRWITRATPSP